MQGTLCLNKQTIPILERQLIGKVRTSYSYAAITYLIELRDDEGATHTIRNRGYMLQAFGSFLEVELGETNIEKITADHVKEFLFSLSRSSKKITTINTYRRIIKWFLQWCFDKGYSLSLNPFKAKLFKDKKEPEKRFTPLDHETVYRVIGKMPCAQDRIITALTFETGMRISEVLGVRVIDINYDEIAVYGKGEKQRPVYIPDDLAESLRVFLENNHRKEGYAFRPLMHGGTRYRNVDTVRQRINKFFKEEGLDFWFHLLRHSFAVERVKRGMDLRCLQVLMGHSSLVITQQYLRFTDPYIKEQAKKYQISAYALLT
ncbi:tyrosine-type recombinase/integrase [Candidatus Saccharibacteria bacterium]|nr:tyrosine-type recombinase/integrase [Candidatus Saccharibacteria bacterium]